MEPSYYHLAFWKQGSSESLLGLILDHYKETRVGIVKAEATTAKTNHLQPVSDDNNWAELHRLSTEEAGARVYIKNGSWIGQSQETNFRRDYSCEEGQMLEIVTSSYAWDPKRAERQFKELSKQFDKVCRILDPDYAQVGEEMSLETPYEFSGQLGQLMYVAERHRPTSWNQSDPVVIGKIIRGLRQPEARHVLDPFWYTGMQRPFPA